MKKNKKIVLVVIIAIILIAVIVITMIFLKNKDKGHSEEPIPKNQVVTSLGGESQLLNDDNYQKELEENKYSLDNAKLYMNPYNASSLTGLLLFYTEKDLGVEVTIKGKHNDDITYKVENGKYHYVPIYYLYENYNNDIIIKLSDGTSKEFNIQTKELDYVPEVTADISTISGNDMYFITSPIMMTSFAIDKFGEVRWVTDAFWYHDITVLNNNHLLIGTNNMKDLIEIDYLGRIYNSYTIDTEYTNSFEVKANGNIIVPSSNKNRNTTSDYIIEVDKDTGKVVKTIDLYEIFNDVDPVFTHELSDGFFYNSGVKYYENTDTLLLTYWGGEFVISLNYKNGAINWIFSNPNNFSSAFDKYLLKSDNNFDYPKSMHSASLNGNTLKVFDNGYSTNNEVTNISSLKGSYSSANTYEITNNKIILVSSIDEGKQYFSYALADYEIVNNTDELILFGRELEDVNYDNGDNINNYDALSSTLIEKLNNETVLKLKIDWPTYSVTKIDSSKKVEFNFTMPNYKTTKEASKYDSLSSEMLELTKNATSELPYNVGYSNNEIETDAYYLPTDEVQVILIDNSNNGYVYTLKAKKEENKKDIIIDLNSGRYDIYVYENGVMYNTNKYIDVE